MRTLLLLAFTALLIGFGCISIPGACGDQVCGSDWKTYGDRCQAEAAGVSVIKTGECGLKCTEDDRGNTPDQSGSVQYKGLAYADFCQGTRITEYYCLNGELQSESKQCTGSCVNGACTSTQPPQPPNPPTNTTTCTDTESGQNVAVKGTVTKGSSTYTDLCANTNQITDYYCSNNDVASVTLNCPSDYECKTGICVKKGCFDDDSGSNIYTKGTASKGDTIYTDYCTASNIVKEYYCSADSIYWSTHVCPSGYLCSDGKCVVGDLCEDSDDGDDKYEKGIVTQGDDEFTDYCKDDDTVKEYYCNDDGNIDSANRDCPSGYQCTGSNGRCTEIAVATACSDNDGGQDTSTKAAASDSTGASGTDSCVDSNTVDEYYCTAGNLLSHTSVDCSDYNGCLDGKCQPTCSETDSGDQSDAGTTHFGSATHSDSCNGAFKLEWSCGFVAFDEPTSSSAACAFGCSDGECNSAPAAVCADSDNGKVYTVKGTTTLTGALPFAQVDSCNEATGKITEWYCQGNDRLSTLYPCPLGCDADTDICNAAAVCTDSDDTNPPWSVDVDSYYEKGTTTVSGQADRTDSCTEATGNITEWYCSSASIRTSTVYHCSFGCAAANDYCNSMSFYTCDDVGDDGNEPSNGGYVKRTYNLPPFGSTSYYDNCIVNSVVEYYCDGSTVKNQTVFCPWGCNTAATGDYCDSFDPF